MKNQIILHYTEDVIISLINHNQSFVHNVLHFVGNNNQMTNELGMYSKDIEIITSIASKYKYYKSISEGQNELVKRILIRYAYKLANKFNKLQGF